MKTVAVRNLLFGEGAPKVCVPLVGKTVHDLTSELKRISKMKFDLIEWRVDHFEKVEDYAEVTKVAAELRQHLGEKPLLMTFRTKKEGGVYDLGDQKYFELYESLVPTGLVDLIDVELFMDAEKVASLVELAHEHHVKVIMCNHDFHKTPAQTEIVQRLRMMQEKGADLCKIAVMPQTPQDVLVLLAATEEMQRLYADRPIITMSMGGLGMVSRISGEVFGSAMTFGAAAEASAPGQVPVASLNDILTIFHDSLV